MGNAGTGHGSDPEHLCVLVRNLRDPAPALGWRPGSQWLQDTVEDAAHQGADIGYQAEVWVPNQAPRHLQEPVQLLQVVAYRFHLLGEGGCLGGHKGAESLLVWWRLP